LDGGNSPSQDNTNTDNRALCEIRARDPSVLAGEDSRATVISIYSNVIYTRINIIIHITMFFEQPTLRYSNVVMIRE
jgi:hypothetical protein